MESLHITIVLFSLAAFFLILAVIGFLGVMGNNDPIIIYDIMAIMGISFTPALLALAFINCFCKGKIRSNVPTSPIRAV
jgi:hypothetical protein